MTIIYLHGLDSDPNATKAAITANHAKELGIDTLRPDLNCPPDDVVAKLLNLIKENRCRGVDDGIVRERLPVKIIR